MEHSIVIITVVQYAPEGNSDVTFCTGFCVEYNEEKYIMSCNHCIGEFFIIKSIHSNTEYEGKHFLSSIYDDLLLIKSDICKLLKPLKISRKIPKLGEKLKTWSFQSLDRGGITTSMGRLKSVDSDNYMRGTFKTLFYKVDIVGLSGDSGCPLINSGGEVMGVLSKYSGDEGDDLPTHFVPNIILHAFLYFRIPFLLKNKRPYTHGDLAIYTQSLNGVLCKYFKYNGEGILILTVDTLYYMKHLKVNDIIVKINDFPLNNAGYMKLKDIYKDADNTIQIHYQSYIFALCKPYENVSITVIRDSKMIKLNMELQEYYQPMYFHFVEVDIPTLRWCGIVFRHIINEISHTYEPRLVSNLHFARTDPDTINNEVKLVYIDFIVYSHILNVGPEFSLRILKSVNDIIIKNIKHLIEVLTDITKNKNMTHFKLIMHDKSIILVYKSDIQQLNYNLYFSSYAPFV